MVDRDRTTAGCKRAVSHNARDQRDLRVAVASSVAVVTAIGLGYWGWLHVRPDDGRAGELAQHFLSRAYLTLQLFVLHPQELPRHVPWQLEVARFLAAALLAIATLYLLTRAFAARLRHAWVTRSRGHVIVCGAGVHGSHLAEILVKAPTRVVLVDINPGAPGLQGRWQARESQLVADAVNADTLRHAGVARAERLIAVTGHDVVNAQIASVVRDLWRTERWDRAPVVLVQAEDSVLARFLEDGDFAQPPARGRSGTENQGTERAVGLEVQTFGANTLAAATLFGGRPLSGSACVGAGDAPLADVEATGGHLLLAGNHGLLEAVVVAALRRGRAQRLRDEACSAARPPLRITLVGMNAPRFADAIADHWQLDQDIIDLRAREVDLRTERSALSSPTWREWQRDVTHAIVACEDEHASIAITVTLSRLLGSTTRLTRVATQARSQLDNRLESYATEHAQLAAITVRSIAGLAWGAHAEGIPAASPAWRLSAALVSEGGDGAEADETAAHLLRQSDLGLHSDPAPRITPASAAVVDGLLKAVRANRPAVSVSALVTAGLSPDLAASGNLRRAAEQLTHEGARDAFAAWCEYARLARRSEIEAAGVLGRAATAQASAAPLQLRAATFGVAATLDALTPDQTIVNDLGRRASPRVAIFAGGAGSMSRETRETITRLLARALYRYDGLVLTGGNDAGVCGAVREAARQNGVPVLGYAPAGCGAERMWLRSTPAGDFSEAEPVAMWTDLLASARNRGHLATASADVRLVAFPGGAITRTEIILARALGAAVASVDPCEELLGPLDEVLPFGAGGVITLPNDPMTLRAFLMWPNERLEGDRRLAAARDLHNQYRRRQRNLKRPDDPALSRWEQLSPMFRRSNLAVVDDIPNKLHVLGKRLTPGDKRLVMQPHEVELLAEMEHGRYNCERLSAGWELGRTRQLSRMVSPYLTPWSDLDDEVRQWDRDLVLGLDAALRAAGWGVTS